MNWAVERLVELVKHGPPVLPWKLARDTQTQQHRGQHDAIESLLAA